MALGRWLVGAAVLTVVGSVGLIAYLWRYRKEPGADWFVASISMQLLWNLLYAISLFVADPAVRRPLESVMVGVATGTSLLFVSFAMTYTGRARFDERLAAIGIVATVFGGIGLLTMNPMGIAVASFRVVPIGGVAGVRIVFEPLMIALGTGIILAAVVGSLVLFDTVVSYGPLYRGEALAVGLSSLPPAAGYAVWLFGVGPVPELNLMPALFLAHVALDGYAFVYNDMFEFNPATRRAGERAAIDDLGSPVVIVDEDSRIVTLNRRAERVLEVTKREALTTSIESHVDASIDLTADRCRLAVDGEDGTRRRYSVTSTPLSDTRGRTVGYTLVWQDVTDAVRRERRLDVLNRVLRHNLRNDMTIVAGFAESAAADTADDGTVTTMLDTVVDTADRLVSLGETAREIETVLDGDPTPEPVDVGEMMAWIGERARETDPEATVCVTCPDVTCPLDGETFEAVCMEIIENAVVHGGPRPTVEIEVTAGEGGVTVRVDDDGPGVPDRELVPIRQGEETALEHGSGLGLWLVRWGMDRLGGDLDFETGEDGTTVILDVPC
ncbi:histidine kinase [Halobacteriales archaeon SW_7_68_16]|nr:MAG: histidine kinase [Halobacteriales archaeon SW_7_68_16]